MNISGLGRTHLRVLSFGLLLSLGAAAQQAQKPAPPPMPQFKPTPNDSLISPGIQVDRRVTFHLYAPQAKSVKIRGEWVADPGMTTIIGLHCFAAIRLSRMKPA